MPSEWAETFKRGNEKTDGVRLVAIRTNGTRIPMRRTLISALPTMRATYGCPASDSDLRFMCADLLKHPKVLRQEQIDHFELEWCDFAEDEQVVCYRGALDRKK